MPAVARVALVGSTASGKSTLAMAVAGQLAEVHIISVDSMQVYRGMDIGTAKPTPAERALVPHHCLDLVDPSAAFTVADFRDAHDAALREIASRGGRALLVGGTGLYHRVIVDDFELPGEWPELRSELIAEAETTGPEDLHKRLALLDPTAAAKIEPSNARRLVRALEVCVGSGRQFSSFGPGVDSYPDTAVVQIGLRRPREVIARRVADRVHRMIELGLVEEVRTLVERGLSRTAAQALGYKEIVEHLEGAVDENEAIETIITRTRRFAVRQDRWFRRDPRVRWIDVDDDPVVEAAPALVAAFESLT
ncbi:MAG: tRNA (adenosine(37)-N6)-dimethylallyltransferase MiaA [Acidimicrobiia bacterium]|nr:tRNA (adenosine(37)-N6)-dimethylallyltransferase MiaA [Acidimicrobiia bacterium]